jgi:hypothetical protein
MMRVLKIIYPYMISRHEDWAAWICDKRGSIFFGASRSFGHRILCSCPWEVSGHEGKGFF